jgi:hypothetical protein
MKYSNPQEAWYHEQKKRPQGEGCMLSVVSVAFLILTIALMLAFSGCTTKRYIPVNHHTTDTLRITQHQRDSIYLHDSIRVSEKGDTIKIEKWHTKYIERTAHDTIYQARHDTIPQPYPVEKLVPMERSKVEWGLIIVGIVALMGCIVWIALKLKRFLP